MSNLLPEGWVEAELGDTCFVTKLAGFEYTQYFDYSIGGEVIAVRVLNLKKGKLDLNNVQRISRKVSEGLPRSRLAKHDIVISYVGTVGEVAIINEDNKYHLAPNVAKISPNNSKIIGEYLVQVLTSDKTQKSIQLLGSITSQPSLSMGNLRKVYIPSPPLAEQQKIAKILTSVDEVIEKTQAQIDKLKDLKTGMMQELLTHGIGHTEFKDSPVGRIPAEWEVVPLANLSAKISDGIHSTPQYTDSLGYYFINGNNLKNGKVIFSKNTKFVSNDEYIKHKKDLGKNTILMSINGTIGNLAYYEGEEVVLGKSASFISLKEEQSRSFIYYVLQSEKIKAFYDLELTGSTIRNLSLRAIKETPIVLPSPDEQTVITKVLSSIDRNLKLKSERLKILLSTKKALMQDLLTGKVRVKLDSE